MRRRLAQAAAATVGAVAALSACSDSPSPSFEAFEVSPESSTSTPTTTPSSASPRASEPSSASASNPSDGKPRRALLSIPALAIRELPVVAYVGKTDDARGTKIQDRGLAASPHGPMGGVGPGGVGNYQVTAHRLSSTQAFLTLPDLRVGQLAVVETAETRYVYKIRDTRKTSFRSPQSLEEQRAAVPGQPGQPATRAHLTLSTCATPEDHAQGNFWSDRFNNPEHRIDKVGVLVRTETFD